MIGVGKKQSAFCINGKVDRVQDKAIRNEGHATCKHDLLANKFLKTLGELYQEGVIGEEFGCRMANNWEKVVDKAALIALGRELVCGRSVSRWDEELCQLVKDCRACFAQGLDNDSKLE